MVTGLRNKMLPRRRGVNTVPVVVEQVVEEPPQHTSLEDDILHLQQRIGYTFVDKELLCRALTHRSVQVDGERRDYERLEFLGDAVLDLAVADLLINVHPEATEGDLSKMRAALVNTESLAELARYLEIGPRIKLSRGEIASGGAERNSILADVLEALFGALYREAGYEQALKTITSVWNERVRTVSPSDPKTELQEVLHALGRSAAQYLLECVEGPEHSPTFVSVVTINREVMGRGRGRTKKLSQQEAAAEALVTLKAEQAEMLVSPEGGEAQINSIPVGEEGE
jgi:ribonuclease III